MNAIIIVVFLVTGWFMIHASSCKADNECDDINCPEVICFNSMCLCAVDYEGALPPYIESGSIQYDQRKFSLSTRLLFWMMYGLVVCLLLLSACCTQNWLLCFNFQGVSIEVWRLSLSLKFSLSSWMFWFYICIQR